ncbi:MAG: fliH [Cyanobacteria bacterium RYN_339]|nr:fliH [Cyanobacteria bacterium RYN_339]
MALRKGSKISFTEGPAVIKDGQLIAAVVAAPVEVAIPAAEPEGPAREAWESEGDFDDIALDGLESVIPQEEQGPDWTQPIKDYEEIREHLIYSANEAADHDMNAFGEQVMEATEHLMAGTLERTQAELLQANPDGDFSRVMPYVQKRVAVELDLELVGTANEIRWTHLQRIEQKIVAEAQEVGIQIALKHEPETFDEIIARREEILSEARMEAERLMMEAMTRSAETQAQAERARAQTIMELESERERILGELREQAYQEGYNEGKAAGESEAARYVSDALQMFNQIAVALPDAVRRNEEKLVTLALEIAAKVIQEEIALQPEMVQRTVETALRRVSDLEQVIVKVNPLDLDLILPKQETFKMLMPDVQNFAIEGSHTILRGGCMIETNSGSINATLEAQLSIVEEIFRNVRAEYEDEALGELS